MLIARFLWRDRVRWGIVDGDEVRALQGELYRGARPGRSLCSLSEVRLLAPVEKTGKVVGIAANYREKDDRDGPGIFMKHRSRQVVSELNVEQSQAARDQSLRITRRLSRSEVNHRYRRLLD